MIINQKYNDYCILLGSLESLYLYFYFFLYRLFTEKNNRRTDVSFLLRKITNDIYTRDLHEKREIEARGASAALHRQTNPC